MCYRPSQYHRNAENNNKHFPIPKSTLLGVVQPTTCLSGFGQPLLVQPTPPVWRYLSSFYDASKMKFFLLSPPKPQRGERKTDPAERNQPAELSEVGNWLLQKAGRKVQKT